MVSEVALVQTKHCLALELEFSYMSGQLRTPICMYIYIYIYIHIHTHIYRERERDREMYMHVYICTQYIQQMCMCMSLASSGPCTVRSMC